MKHVMMFKEAINGWLLNGWVDILPSGFVHLVDWYATVSVYLLVLQLYSLYF